MNLPVETALIVGCDPVDPRYVIASPVTKPWLGMVTVSLATLIAVEASIRRRVVPTWKGSYGLKSPVSREYEILSSTLPPEVIDAEEKATFLLERVFVK